MTIAATLQPSSAVRNGMPLGKFLERTSRMLDSGSLQRLSRARLVIAGCGGLGGAVALTMARLGVGNFVLADPGRFDEPDINRQWAADGSTLGQNKAAVYGDWLTRVNPQVRVETYPEGVTWDNVERLVDGADVVVDCLDISVDMKLRDRLFQLSYQAGAHSLTAPVLGFGTFIAIAAPNGMSMQPVIELLRQTTVTAQLPRFARRFFSSACVEALERDMPTGKLPSLAIGPTVAGALVSTELLLILAKGRLPSWREPICLPRVLMMDTLNASYRIANLSELVAEGDCKPVPATPRVTHSSTPRERREWLRAAHFNTHLLPPTRVRLDLLTDSWGELSVSDRPAVTQGEPNVEERFCSIYGYPHALAVTRGRFAEALLAAAFIQPGALVVGNALFPSTRFHIESRGAKLLDLSGTPSGSPADLDLERLAGLIAERERSPLGCVWIEACCNAWGGAPVSLSNLRAVHELCKPAGIPVLLDATRLLENVLLCQPMTASPRQLLHTYTRYTDACAMSAMKDFPVRHGGFVATHSEEVHGRLRDLLLAFGNGLSEEHRMVLSAALQGDPFAAAAERLRVVQELHRAMQAIDIPMLHPCGGHAVVLDAGRLLPHLAADQCPAQALANALYVHAGVRGGLHFAALAQQNQLLRLAVPVARHGSQDLEPVIEAMMAIRQHSETVEGLRPTFHPAGALGRLLAHYEPIRGSNHSETAP